MRTSSRSALLALGALLAAGCSSEWRYENRDQELWWTMAERGASSLRRGDPFACPAGYDAYTCETLSRRHFEEKCAMDDADACYHLGHTILLGGPEAAPPDDARRFLELGCRIGWKKGKQDATRACTLLGVAHLVGLGGFTPDPKLGAALLGERCMMKDDLACAYLAYAREKGLGVEADLERAIEGYDDVCSARHDGFEDDPADPSDPPRRRWQPFACLRLAFLADNRVIDVPPEFTAQLFAAVCFFDDSLNVGTSTAEPNPRALGRVACPVAAERFIAHGYAYRALRATPGGYRTDVASFEFDAEGLAKRGCSDGDDASCNLLRGMFEQAEARGEIFDLR